MKKLFKKSLAVIMVVVLTLTAAPLSGFVGLELPSLFDFKAEAAESYSGVCGDNLIWTLDTETGVLEISGKGEMYDYGYHNTTWYDVINCITAVDIGNGVTTIGNYAFQACTSLESVTIPDSVTRIGMSAFSGCTNIENLYYIGTVEDWLMIDFTYYSHPILNGSNPMECAQNVFFNGEIIKELVIPDSVYYIDYAQFAGLKSVEKVVVSQGVKEINLLAFSGCTSLESVTIDSNVNLSIKDGAFNDCTSLESVTIGSNVTYISDQAFNHCTSLKDITVDANNEYYSSDSCGVLFIKKAKKLLKYPSGNTRTSYTIPDNITSICENAFSDCTILTSLTMPDSVTTIYSSAFGGCTNLENIYYTGDIESWCNITFIDRFANPSCYANKIYIGGVASVNIVIPDTITQINDYTFCNWRSLKSVVIPNTVMSIGAYAFDGCESLTSITIPDSVTNIGSYAFATCTSLTSITIPDSVASIGYGEFSGCESLKSVTIPDSVTSIDWYAFSGCTNLESVTIPDSVTGIGRYVFRGCTSLKYVHIPDTVTVIGSGILWDTTAYICSTTKDCYAKTYADAIGIEFKLCTDHGTDHGEEDNYGINIPEDIVFIDKDEHYLFSAYDINGNDITEKANWSSTTSVDCTGEVKITNNGDVQGVKQGLTNLHASYWDKETLENLGDDSCYVFVGEPNEVKYTSVSDQIYYYGENAFYSDAADFSDSVDIYLSLENALNEQIDDLTEYEKYADELSALDIKGYTLTAKVSGSNLSFDKDEFINNYISAVDGKIPVGKAVDELLTLYPYNLDVDSADKSFTVTIQIESDDFDTITDSFTFKISSLEDKEINEHISFINTNGVYKAMRDDDFATNMTELKNEDQYILTKYFSLDFENYYEVVMADILAQLMGTKLTGNISILPALKEWKSNYDTILSCVSTIVEDTYAGSTKITDNLISKVFKKSKYTTEGMDVDDEVRDLVVLKLRDKVSIDKINSAFAALDKTGQCLDLFDMGVNISNDIINFVNCISIMNSYQGMNDEFKNVIQKVSDCIPSDDWKVKEAVNHYVKLDTAAGYTQEIIESVIELSKDVTLEVFNSCFKKQFVSMFTKAVGDITLKSGKLLSSTTGFSAISTSLGVLSTGVTLGVCISDFLCNNSGQAAEMGRVVAASQIAPYVIQTLKYYEWALGNYKDVSSLKHFETAFKLNKALQMYSIEHSYKGLEVQANSLIIKLFSNKDYPGAMAELASLKTMHQNCDCCADVPTVVVKTKTIAIKCPVDVYVYDESGKEVVRIINDVAVYVANGINVFINEREKYITVPADQEYSVKIIATDEGTMDYLVMEHNENGEYEVAFSDFNIALNNGKEFYGKICDEFNAAEDAYKISTVFDGEIKINKTSTTAIKYGDTLVLRLDEIEIPEGYAIAWFVEGAGVLTSVSEDGLECRVTSIANGNAVISAKIVSENGEAISDADGEAISDEITLVSKAGFWQKFVSFFKNLFRMNRVIY